MLILFYFIFLIALRTMHKYLGFNALYRGSVVVLLLDRLV